MDEWQVGDPTGFGNDAGVPDIPYMGYLQTDDDDDTNVPPQTVDPNVSRAKRLADEAYELQEEDRFDEALVLINRALELDSNNFNNWNVKAIIIDNSGHPEDAIEFYDRALAIRPTNVVKTNKAECLYRIAYIRNAMRRSPERSLEIINEALKLLPDDEERGRFIHMKGRILQSLDRKIQAKKCFLLADGMTDKIMQLEEQEKIIKNTRQPLINITGTQFYKGCGILKEGIVVDLIKEPENEHDSNAIRVELNGETVGYVADSPYTLIDGLKSARQIQDRFTDKTRAKFLFRFMDEFNVAKLI